MKLPIVWMLLLFAVTQVYGQNKINRVSELVKTISLEKDLLYEFFEADGSYVSWTEFYTSKVMILDLESLSVSELKLNRGRGPNEFQDLLSLSLYNHLLYYMTHQILKSFLLT